MSCTLPTTEKTTLKRAPNRAVKDRQALYNIIDSNLICHVAFQSKDETFVIPTLGWRMGNRFYIHGSNGSRMLKSLLNGQTAAISLAVLDGLVLARSAFHHSANFRSAVLFGVLEVVEGDEKEASLDHFVNHLVAGRADQARQANANELAATTVLGLDIEEASAKMRTGGPNDDEKDLQQAVWAGEVPFVTQIGEIIPCDKGRCEDSVEQELKGNPPSINPRLLDKAV